MLVFKIWANGILYRRFRRNDLSHDRVNILLVPRVRSSLRLLRWVRFLPHYYRTKGKTLEEIAAEFGDEVVTSDAPLAKDDGSVKAAHEQIEDYSRP